MELMLWGFAGFAAVVAVIIGVAVWTVSFRDRGEPNQGVRMRSRTGPIARSDPRRGVPRSR